MKSFALTAVSFVVAMAYFSQSTLIFETLVIFFLTLITLTIITRDQ